MQHPIYFGELKVSRKFVESIHGTRGTKTTADLRFATSLSKAKQNHDRQASTR